MANCERCGKEFDNFSKWGTKRFCSRSCANAHIHTTETKQKIAKSATGRTVSDETKQKISAALEGRDNYWKRGKQISEQTRSKMRAAQIGKVVSESTRKKQSDNAVARGLGGHTSKRKIWYTQPDGTVVFLQSGYEVLMAKLLDEMGIGWVRPEPVWWCDSEGNRHRYYPDFQVGDVYFDTKNDYLIQKDAEKIRLVIEQTGIRLHVLGLSSITKETIASLVQW